MVKSDEREVAILQKDKSSLDDQQSKLLLAALKSKYEQQIKELKEDYDSEQNALNSQLTQLKALFKTKNGEVNSNESVENELSLSKQRNEQFERVIQHLRERMEESKLEAKTLRDELESVYSRQAGVDFSLENQDRYEQLHLENKQLAAKLEETLNARIAAENELNQERQKLQEREKALLEESESHLRIAQQHLAKKVKEATILSERESELRREHEELKQASEITKTRVFELQGFLEGLRDGIKSAEMQAVKWEEKYFGLYHKLQESEIRCRELKKIEEKFIHIQKVLFSLGSFIEARPPELQSLETQHNNEQPPAYDFFGYQQIKE